MYCFFPTATNSPHSCREASFLKAYFGFGVVFMVFNLLLWPVQTTA